MKKNVLSIFLILFSIAAAFFLGKMFGTYSHSIMQEAEYPFYLRETLASNMPDCDVYKNISNSNNKTEIKILKDEQQGPVVMITTAKKSEGNTKLLVSIINARHEQYFDEVFLDCPQ